MVNNTKGVDIVVARWKGRFEPLHAIYAKECLKPIERQLKRNNLKITNFFSQVNVKVIEQREIERFVLQEEPFLNINTKADHRAIIERGQRSGGWI